MKIYIRNLRIKTIIGCNEAERKSPRDLILNIELEIEPNDACKTDVLENTLNYAEVVDLVQKLVVGSEFKLLERLAQYLIEELCKKYLQIEQIIICIDKPNIFAGVESVGVELTHKVK
jgi:7,8-dihydroneopterin aldolase/epimerase/oxygenase